MSAVDSTLALMHQSGVPRREQIERLELTMRDLPQVELPLNHGFGHGFYTRSLFIPADTVVTGKVHRCKHVFMLTQGDISITTDEGVKRVQAPYLSIGEPGAKRAVYAHTDSVCVNVHLTYETDLAQLESALVEVPIIAAEPPKELV